MKSAKLRIGGLGLSTNAVVELAQRETDAKKLGQITAILLKKAKEAETPEKEWMCLDGAEAVTGRFVHRTGAPVFFNDLAAVRFSGVGVTVKKGSDECNELAATNAIAGLTDAGADSVTITRVHFDPTSTSEAYLNEFMYRVEDDKRDIIKSGKGNIASLPEAITAQFSSISPDTIHAFCVDKTRISDEVGYSIVPYKSASEAFPIIEAKASFFPERLLPEGLDDSLKKHLAYRSQSRSAPTLGGAVDLWRTLADKQGSRAEMLDRIAADSAKLIYHPNMDEAGRTRIGSLLETIAGRAEQTSTLRNVAYGYERLGRDSKVDAAVLVPRLRNVIGNSNSDASVLRKAVRSYANLAENSKIDANGLRKGFKLIAGQDDSDPSVLSEIVRAYENLAENSKIDVNDVREGIKFIAGQAKCDPSVFSGIVCAYERLNETSKISGNDILDDFKTVFGRRDGDAGMPGNVVRVDKSVLENVVRVYGKLANDPNINANTLVSELTELVGQKEAHSSRPVLETAVNVVNTLKAKVSGDVFFAGVKAMLDHPEHEKETPQIASMSKRALLRPITIELDDDREALARFKNFRDSTGKPMKILTIKRNDPANLQKHQVSLHSGDIDVSRSYDYDLKERDNKNRDLLNFTGGRVSEWDLGVATILGRLVLSRKTLDRGLNSAVAGLESIAVGTCDEKALRASVSGLKYIITDRIDDVGSDEINRVDAGLTSVVRGEVGIEEVSSDITHTAEQGLSEIQYQRQVMGTQLGAAVDLRRARHQTTTHREFGAPLRSGQRVRRLQGRPDSASDPGLGVPSGSGQTPGVLRPLQNDPGGRPSTPGGRGGAASTASPSTGIHRPLPTRER